MTVSVADRVKHRLPRPVKCDACGSPRVALQKRKFMKLRVTQPWDLIWHCADCDAVVGCHEGTDIPLGLMADAQTRGERYLAHKAFDPLWKGKGAVMQRRAAYDWLAKILGVPAERAHIGMLTLEQCTIVQEAAAKHYVAATTKRSWKQLTRKKRRK